MPLDRAGLLDLSHRVMECSEIVLRRGHTRWVKRLSPADRETLARILREAVQNLPSSTQ